MLSTLVNQYKHMNWANQKLIALLRQETEVIADAIELMSHVVSAERIWLARICGRSEVLVPWSKLSLDECEAYSTTNCAEYLKVILQLDEDRLCETVTFNLTNGEPMSSLVGDILCHVPVHGSHHRGQLCKIFAQNAIAPPVLDYIVYSMQPHGLDGR